MQKDHLLTLLTVWEYMIMSAHLKLGDQVSNREKKTTVLIYLHKSFMYRIKSHRGLQIILANNRLNPY